MTDFIRLTKEKEDITRKAYKFELEAIKNGDSSENPYFNAIMAMPDGKALWEAINLAVEMAFK